MFYYLYEIKNKVNGKIYVGVHKTLDMNDSYMGSGKVILAAIKKYGIENFSKSILETFDGIESMYAREKEIVTEEFLNREDVYNLRRGGSGGFDYINFTKTFEERSIAGKKCHEKHPDLGTTNLRNAHKLECYSKGTCTKKEKYGDDYFKKISTYERTKEHKNNQRLAALKNQHLYEKVECPHCGKIGGKNAMLRFHFEKCKK